MKINTAFWDTSAIVPLCVLQDTTSAARQIRRKFSKSAIWWGATVEFYSSLSRMVSAGVLNKSANKTAENKWTDFQTPARIIQPTDVMLEIAVDLPEKFGLRSLDAFQLAAALVWCREKPLNRPFVSADLRLAEAASNAGFDAIALT